MLIEFNKVNILRTAHGTDEVLLELVAARHPIPSSQGSPIIFKTEVARGSGPAWVRDTIGVEPEILDPFHLGE